MPATAAGLTAFMSALSSLEMLQNPFEGPDYRLAPHAFPVAGELARLAGYGAPARPREAHRADGLSRAAAAGAGDAGHGKRDRALAAVERALRHFARGFLADRAVRVQRALLHTEQLTLGLVRVSHEAALEPGGGPGHRRDDLRRPAPGTRFGGDELRARRLQAFADFLRKRFH